MSGPPGPWVPPPAASPGERADSALWAVGRAFGILRDPKAWLPPAILGAIALLPTAVAPAIPPVETLPPGVPVEEALRRIAEPLAPTLGATFVLGLILYPIQAALLFRAATNYLAGRPQAPLAPGLDQASLRFLAQFLVLYAVTFGLGLPVVASILTGEVGLVLLLALLYLAVVLVMAVRLAPSAVFIVSHDQGGVEALATAWRLTSGNAWRVLRWLVVAGVTVGLLTWIVEAITTTLLGPVLSAAARNYVALVVGAPLEAVAATVTVLLARSLLRDGHDVADADPGGRTRLSGEPCRRPASSSCW